MKRLDDVLQFLKENEKKSIEILKDLVKIPSVSFPNFPKEKVVQSAKMVKSLLENSGLENSRLLYFKNSHPWVYGEWLHAENAPTILLYAHHDVQPSLDASLWNTNPFAATEKNGRLYGRGCADDKAGIVLHIMAISAWIQATGSLPVNVRVLIEGEEETGSEHLDDFLKEYSSLLKSDILILADLANFATGVPSITNSLRGMVSLELQLNALKTPLHSGLWGGPLPDPSFALSRILSNLINEEGAPNIPGLDKPNTPSQKEKKLFESLFKPEQFREEAGLLNGELLLNKKSIAEQLWLNPCLTVTSMESGNRNNAGNIIPDHAWARLSMRIAPGMDEEKSLDLLKKRIRELCPWNLEPIFSQESFSPPWSCSTKDPAFISMQKCMSESWNRSALFIGCGASVPFVESYEKNICSIPALLVGVEDPESNAHGINESLNLNDFFKIIQSETRFFEDISEYFGNP